MAFYLPQYLSVTTTVWIVVLVVVARQIYWQLTIGVARRRLIRETGALPPRHYKHQGMLGRLFGYDLIKENIAYAKVGGLLDRQRERSFGDQNTLEFNIMRNKSMIS